MADLANPTEISEFALSLSTPDYMAAWSAYTTDPRFVHRPDRLAGIRALAGRHAHARDELRPRYPERAGRRPASPPQKRSAPRRSPSPRPRRPTPSTRTRFPPTTGSGARTPRPPAPTGP